MSETSDQMAPEASPAQLPNKSGVRRVNNMPMYLIGGVIGLFMLVMALVAADRGSQQHKPVAGPKEKAGNTSMFAKEIAGERTSGMVEPAKPPVVPDLPNGYNTNPEAVGKPGDLETPPAPPLMQPSDVALRPPSDGRMNTSIQDDEAMRIRMAKLQQIEEAVRAKTGVPIAAPRSSGSTPGGRPSSETPQTREEVLARISEIRQQIEAQRSTNPTAAYQERLAQIRGLNAGGSGAGDGSTQPQLLLTSSNAGSTQPTSPGTDRWKLESKVEPPRSPYELRAGFVVPATLISGINSDLPGQIMAQVSQNVYDTPTGKHLLIPLGSRLVGSYASEVKYGQARVLVAWQRIIFPDGKALDIGSMPGADSAGYAGFHDQVNNHYLRLFGSAFLMSGVTAGITYSQRQNQAQSTDDAPSAGSVLSEALGQQLGQVAAQLIAKNLSISPTLEIRPGYRFNVVVTKDMTFSKPYRSFDY